MKTSSGVCTVEVTRESPFLLKEQFNGLESLRIFVAPLLKICPLYINREMLWLSSDVKVLIFKIQRLESRVGGGNPEPEVLRFCIVTKLFCPLNN